MCRVFFVFVAENDDHHLVRIAELGKLLDKSDYD